MKRIVFFILGIVFLLNLTAQNIGALANSRSEILSWNKYPTYTAYIEFMHYYDSAYSDICTLDTIGYTVENRLLLALKIGENINNDVNVPKVFYSSSMHGDELTGAIVLLHLIDTLLSHNDDFSSLLNSTTICICPFANPDGTWADGDNTLSGRMRENANYVDLNRNFPDIRGANYSDGEQIQIETQAFMNYALRERFSLNANLHGGSEVFNYPWDSYNSYSKTHADKNWFETIGEEFVNHLSSNNDGYFTDVNNSGVVDGGDWYIIGGGRQDWHNYFAHQREVTIEVSMDKTPSASLLPKYWKYLKESMLNFLSYANKGFAGVVSDSISGNLLKDVMVKVDNHDKDSSEVFSNMNGYYVRLMSDGNYSVTFSKEGYIPKTIEVQCSGNLAIYDVKLVPTNIERVENYTFDIFPQPAKDALVIKSDGIFSYQIISISGQKIKEGKINKGENTLPLHNIPKGSYVLLINSNEKVVYSGKIIKN